MAQSANTFACFIAALCHTVAALPTLQVTAPDTLSGHKLVGQRVGETFGKQIRIAFDLDSELQAAAEDPDVQELLDASITFHRNEYPLYWAEIEGIAEGSGLPLRLVAAANFRQEITSITNTPSSHCTDTYMTNGTTLSMAHNEDYSPIFFDSMYILSATFGDEMGNPHSFTAFCYPGVLPGWSVGLRENFMFSVNLLFPKRSNPAAIDSELLSVVFSLRGVLSARDVVSAVNSTQLHTMRYGYSLNLIDVGKCELHQMEVAPAGVVSHKLVSSKVPEVGLHANAYLRMPQVPQITNFLNGSQHRMARFEQLESQVKSSKDLLMILGDTGDTDWPLFRSAIFPDKGATLATWQFDLDQRMAYVYRHRPDGARFSPTLEHWATPLVRVPFPIGTDTIIL